MKKLLALWLLLMPMAQAAPPPCYPWDSAAKNLEISTTPESKAALLTAPSTQAGFVVSWWCDAKYNWVGTGFYGNMSELVPSWRELAAGWRTADKATLDAAWTQYLATPAENNALHAALQQQFIVTEPKPIIWRVKDNPTATSRPTFPLVNGVRSTVAAAERVSDTATDCQCFEKALEESGGTYCSVRGQPNVLIAGTLIPDNRVAVCVRVN